MAQSNDDDNFFAAYKKPFTTHGTAKKGKGDDDDFFAAYQKPHVASAPAFAVKTPAQKDEGLYQMQGPDKKFLAIPYSSVMTAAGAEYKMTPKERERYASDRRAEILKSNPNIREWAIGWDAPSFKEAATGSPWRVDPEYEKKMQLPEALPETPGLWSQAENWVQQKTEPTTKHPGMPQPFSSAGRKSGLELEANTAKRVGRVLFGIVDMTPQAYSAVKDSLSADPQKSIDGQSRLRAMHPDAQIMNRLKELREDFHRDPKLALANVEGDVVGFWLAGKAGELPGQVGRYATETFPLRSINNLIRPMAADVKFGKNPAQAILEEKITGNSLHELGDKTFAKIHEVGKRIDELAQQNAGKQVDVSSTLKPIDDAMATAQKAGDKELYQRLALLKNSLIYEWEPVLDANGNPVSLRPLKDSSGKLVKRNLSSMTPEQALHFKRMVGDRVYWTGVDPFESTVNEAAGQVYGNIKDKLNEKVPGLKDLNQRYGNLVGAGKAIERRIPIEERNAYWSLSDVVMGSTGHLPIAIARKVFTLPAVKTRVASGLYRLGLHGPREPMLPRGTPKPPTPRGKVTTAIKTATQVAAAVKPTKNAKELNAEAARLAGATPAAMPSQPPSAPAAPSRPSAVHPVLSSPAINRAAKASGVSPNLLRAVTEQESGGKAGAVSVKGATGVMQLMPATAKKYGATDATDPEQNLMAGAQYLRDLLDKHHGDITEALKDYYGRGTPPPGYPSADKYAQAVLGRFKSLSAPQSQTAAQPKKTPRELQEEARRLAGLSGAVQTGTNVGADTPQ